VTRRFRTRFRGRHRRAPSGIPVGPEDADTLWFDLADGSTVLLRPIHPGDKEALAEGFQRLSEQTRYQRFLAPMARLTPRQVKYLTEIDQVNHFAWVAGRRDASGTDHGLGVARYVRVPGGAAAAEFAVVVADDAQGLGLGTLLVESLMVVAADRGLASLEGLCFAENHIMLHVLGRLGARITTDSPGVLMTTTPLPAPISLKWRVRRALRSVARRAAAR
jgi:GNAT superfamily N-acetyltransferase